LGFGSRGNRRVPSTASVRAAYGDALGEPPPFPGPVSWRWGILLWPRFWAKMRLRTALGNIPIPQENHAMPHHTFKHIKVTGTSADSIEEAVRGAVQKASQTVRNMRWFQVVETRGAISGGNVAEWQVTVEIGFGLDE
jgi:flavin-binding protein dodecin